MTSWGTAAALDQWVEQLFGGEEGSNEPEMVLQAEELWMSPWFTSRPEESLHRRPTRGSPPAGGGLVPAHQAHACVRFWRALGGVHRPGGASTYGLTTI